MERILSNHISKDLVLIISKKVYSLNYQNVIKELKIKTIDKTKIPFRGYIIEINNMKISLCNFYS